MIDGCRYKGIYNKVDTKIQTASTPSEPVDLVQLEAILREADVPDEDAPAHAGLACAVGEEQQVVAVYGEAFVGQLGAPSAAFLDGELRTGTPRPPRIAVEGKGEAAVGQATPLAGVLHGHRAGDDERFVHGDGWWVMTAQRYFFRCTPQNTRRKQCVFFTKRRIFIDV